MALVFGDRVYETSTTTGNGTLTLAGIGAANYRTFSAVIGDGNTCYYAIVHRNANEWEVGVGTVSAGALARTTVLMTSAGNQTKIVFSAGTKDVFNDMPAERIIAIDAAGTGTTSLAGVALTAGAASFTTLAVSSTAAITGNLTVGASTFVVTASTGYAKTANTSGARFTLDDTTANMEWAIDAGMNGAWFAIRNLDRASDDVKIASGSGAVTLASSLTSTSPTGGLGYSAGAGGAQTQATNKQTGVTSNTITTAITMNAENLAAATTTAFTFTNSAIAATDTVLVTHASAGTSGAYTLNAFPGAGSAVISLRNNTAGGLAEAIVLRVTVIKSVSA